MTTLVHRRTVIKALAGASTFPLWGRLSARAAATGTIDVLPIPDRMLLVVFLEGGNDGLNTVVPTDASIYRRARPAVALPSSDVLALGRGMGLNRALPFLFGLWQKGQLAIVQNVGYPKPRFSHFESSTIWQSGTTDLAAGDGWLGRYLGATDPTTPSALRAVSIGGALPLALTSPQGNGVAIGSLPSFTFPDGSGPVAQARHEALKGMARSAGSDMWGEVARAGARMVDAVRRVSTVASGSAKTPGQALALLMASGLGTEIGWAGIGGFDTHADQVGRQQAGLRALNSLCSDFFTAATGLGIADRVTLLVFTEFGRRVADNGSGTDHGSAQPVLVAGSRVAGGFVGHPPDLSKLDDGNLVFEIDFRSVYASMLEQVLRTDADPILGAGYPRLSLVS